jgi:hypothetical protein
LADFLGLRRQVRRPLEIRMRASSRVRRGAGPFGHATGLSSSVAAVAQSAGRRGHDAVSDDAARCDLAQSARVVVAGIDASATPGGRFHESVGVNGMRSEPSMRGTGPGADHFL